MNNNNAPTPLEVQNANLIRKVLQATQCSNQLNQYLICVHDFIDRQQQSTLDQQQQKEVPDSRRFCNSQFEEYNHCLHDKQKHQQVSVEVASVLRDSCTEIQEKLKKCRKAEEGMFGGFSSKKCEDLMHQVFNCGLKKLLEVASQ